MGEESKAKSATWADRAERLRARVRAYKESQRHKEADELLRGVSSEDEPPLKAAATMSPEAKSAAAVVGILLLLGLQRSPKSQRRGVKVPKPAEYLLYLFLSKNDRENLLGDLAEDYAEVRRKFGRRAANFWYWKQTVSSTWPLFRKAIRWGLIVWVEEWIRRRI